MGKVTAKTHLLFLTPFNRTAAKSATLMIKAVRSIFDVRHTSLFNGGFIQLNNSSLMRNISKLRT